MDECSTPLSIAEVSRLTGISGSALRYYESIGLMEPVGKNSGGHRRYVEKDLRRISFIQQLRCSGVPVQEIKRYVDLVYEGVHTIPERKQLLIDQLSRMKAEVAQLQNTIDTLDNIIENYEDTLIRRELERRSADQNAYHREKPKSGGEHPC